MKEELKITFKEAEKYMIVLFVLGILLGSCIAGLLSYYAGKSAGYNEYKLIHENITTKTS